MLRPEYIRELNGDFSWETEIAFNLYDKSSPLQNPKKARVTNRFLVTEGLFVNTGQITNLPRLVSLTSCHVYMVIKLVRQ